VADDLGLPGLGCTGGVFKTPHIDALAAGGVRFDHCFATPLCAPSRATLLTGRYSFRTGVKDNATGEQATPQKDGCLALPLKKAGYATALAGKWRHLGHFTTREDGTKWGFDEFLIWGVGDIEGEEAAPPDAKDGIRRRPNRYWNPGYIRNGEPLEEKGKYAPDVLQEFVLDFIRRHQREPFFVYYPMPLIHQPLRRTPDSSPEKLDLEEQLEGGDGSLYGDNIHYLDKLVGQLVAELDALGLRENTLILFTADNGSLPVGTVDGRSIDGKKGTLTEGGSRVALVANRPGVTPKGTVCPDLVDFSDFLPTIAELCGATLDDGLQRDGRSFAPQLRGERGHPREWVYVQLQEDCYLRDERWKLTCGRELFDMQDAPFRQVLVPADSTDAAAQAARARLQASLAALRSDRSGD
jgi:arylsulfatase A